MIYKSKTLMAFMVGVAAVSAMKTMKRLSSTKAGMVTRYPKSKMIGLGFNPSWGDDIVYITGERTIFYLNVPGVDSTLFDMKEIQSIRIKRKFSGAKSVRYTFVSGKWVCKNEGPSKASKPFFSQNCSDCTKTMESK